jgi:hypothetical protein
MSKRGAGGDHKRHPPQLNLHFSTIRRNIFQLAVPPVLSEDTNNFEAEK